MIRKDQIKQAKKDYLDSIKISGSNGSVNNRAKTQSFQKQYQDQFSKEDFLADLQNLDIDPIENTTGDKFVIDEIDQRSHSYSSKFTDKKNQTEQILFAQSIVWPDVFYGKKNIMSLLQQRNDICEMYNLNSKSLKQSNTLVNKRIYSDAQIVQYVKQLFSQSPSYPDYDSMCFTILPQITPHQTQKYFIFMSSDLKFVPQCKICNFTTFLILNVQKKSKNTQQLKSRLEKSSSIKGKIICSNKNCKKSLLGQFFMNHKENTKNKTQVKFSNDSKSFNYQIQKKKSQTEKKNQPELSERQKVMIKKAAFKINS